MTKEDKEILLKDLCARLPYGVKIHTSFMGHENDEELIVINKNAMLGDYESVVINPVEDDINDGYELENVKPYLRPMSSITEEEKKDIENYLAAEAISSHSSLNEALRAQRHTTNFLYSKHLDVLGLIEKGLALEATEGMYK